MAWLLFAFAYLMAGLVLISEFEDNHPEVDVTFAHVLLFVAIWPLILLAGMLAMALEEEEEV